MTDYERPVVRVMQGRAESIYLASGAGEEDSDQYDSDDVCNSIYMKGVFHQPNPNGLTYMDKKGCVDCRKGSANRCKLETGAYKEDPNGKNRPEWEKKGHQPNEIF